MYFRILHELLGNDLAIPLRPNSQVWYCRKMEEEFDSEKSVQVAALFIEMNGGAVDRYALIKMMYDADREARKRWGHSMTGDKPYSLKYGPVLSHITNLTKGCEVPEDPIWRKHIFPAGEDNVVSLRKPLKEKKRLAKSDIGIIANVFTKLGQMNFNELKDWSHSLPEYEKVGHWESKPISVEGLLKHLGKTKEEIDAIKAENKESALLRVLAEA
jgi:hypothetical protein